MDATAWLVLVAAAMLGGGGWALLRARSARGPQRPPEPGIEPVTADAGTAGRELPGTPAEEPKDEMLELIEALPGPVVLVNSERGVGFASDNAIRLGLVGRGKLVLPDLAAIASTAADIDEVVVRETSVRRPPLRKGRIDLRVRAIPLGGRGVLLLIDDLTEEARVATIRRDFIANVSHELKTPVGAISLLAEALISASHDPAAVQHFAQRMHAEAGRLSNLINDVIDLSRLQSEEPLADAGLVAVDDLVHEAVEFVRASAEAKQIEIVTGGQAGLKVMGMADQLVTAIRNLLANAIAYSPEGTRVAVAVRRLNASVEIAVKDQGMGIDEEEQSRIFERFYRVDAARSRVTGGTGLGLAIVRNVCRNHGGDVSVWSVPSEGSTFTIQLPLYLEKSDGPIPATGDDEED